MSSSDTSTSPVRIVFPNFHQQPHKIEQGIENFLETFKNHVSTLDSRMSFGSGDSSGFTSSVPSTNSEYAGTLDSPDKEGLFYHIPDKTEWIKRQGIIDESRRISEWAWSRFQHDDQPDISSVGKQTQTSNSGDVMATEPTCPYSVLDVAHLLQSKFAILTGGKAKNGAPILIFADRPNEAEVPDEEYKKVITYLSSITLRTDKESGFVVVIDRRNDGWGAVRSILLKISGFFPCHVQVAFLLQPKGFFQRAFADFRSKFVKEELEFKVVLCDTVSDIFEHIDKSQLTIDLGGELEYDPNEWTEHRSAVEKFHTNIDVIAESLVKLVKKLEEVEIPNDKEGTEAMIKDHLAERKEILADLISASTHGKTLLNCIKGGDSEEDTDLVKQVHVDALQTLLDQLNDAKKKFSEFWETHEEKLRQCLKLRQFEEEFKLVQYSLERKIEILESKMDITGESLQHVESMIEEFKDFEDTSKKDIESAERMRATSDQMILDDTYAVDCIRPKCIELQRMCEQYKECMRKRQEILNKSHDLHDRLDKANKWCTRGVDLLASQPLESCQTTHGAERSLRDIESFLATTRELKLNNPREFRALFEDMMTPETRNTVQQVLKRMDDVQGMFAKRKESIQKLTRHPNTRPVQHVYPEPAHSDHGNFNQEFKRKSDTRRSNTSLDKSLQIRNDHLSTYPASSGYGSKSSSIASSGYVDMTDSNTQRSSLSSMSGSSLPEIDSLQAKQRCVMNELIDTELSYVRELEQILQGYYFEMDKRHMQHLVPPDLVGRRHVLFGNLEEIYNFHSNTFLQELQNCRDMPARVGKCFVNRKLEFQIYSTYCQNKPKSEALRAKIGDSNSCFKECQRKLGHKLPLGAYLLKPVQRITKYQLLLKEMLRFTAENPVLESQIQEALDTMLSVLRYLNDSMHQVSIVDFNESMSDQGRLLMHASFNVWTDHKKEKLKDLRFKAMRRHVFLYEKSILFCKKREESQHDGAVYSFKKKIKLSQVGLTETVKGDKKKFELWSRGREEVYIIQAPTLESKEIWIKEIKKVLLNQFDQLKVTPHNQHRLSQEDVGRGPKYDAPSYGFESWRHHNNNSTTCTVPQGLGMVSPIESPTGPPLEYQDDDGWSSGEFSATDEEEPERYIPKIEPSFRQQFMSLADYFPVDVSEIGLKDGDIVEILRVGTNGWWFARHMTEGTEGWVPSTYLEPIRRRNMSPSVSSGSNDSFHTKDQYVRGYPVSPGEETTV
ncbi:guanine nucleotide exchange factor DBS isoform X1 [Patella vulgata]|uniref:guanine nucleotide exchange factor DBS isoform X1 n=2 Tax=Patella vulgata TaxID=6465 RepID=UPI0024A90841|nr:guanine nucleotide exchange factor DBS isoform X1 [Patella vulgata]